MADGMPDRLLYEELLELLEEDFELLAPGTTCIVDGCTGYCPDCRSRPWCDNGLMRWPEDEEAHCMVVPDRVKAFVSADRLAFDRLVPEP